MRQLVAFILVMVVVGSVAYFGWKAIVEHGSKYNGVQCGGVRRDECPAGYECVDNTGKTLSVGEFGKCRFLLGL